MSGQRQTNLLRTLMELGIDSTTVQVGSLGPGGYSVLVLDEKGRRIITNGVTRTMRKRWRNGTAERLVHDALVDDMIGWGHDNTN